MNSQFYDSAVSAGQSVVLSLCSENLDLISKGVIPELSFDDTFGSTASDIMSDTMIATKHELVGENQTDALGEGTIAVLMLKEILGKASNRVGFGHLSEALTSIDQTQWGLRAMSDGH